MHTQLILVVSLGGVGSGADAENWQGRGEAGLRLVEMLQLF